jgi:hypothetical protein
MKNRDVKEIIFKRPDEVEILIEVGGIKHEIRGFEVTENSIILKNG